MITGVTLEKIEAQAIKEIAFDRQHKQGKVSNWQKNENMYYGVKEKTEESRANVELGQMQSFVHTILSKIDNPLVFKYAKRKLSQLRRVERLNALRQMDAQRDFWDLKDLVGKKQAVIYGRSIYSYYAESINGYQSHLEPIDVYDFLIDPAAGGLDIEKARHLGNYGVVLDRSELEAGKGDTYIKERIETLLNGKGNASNLTVEETNKHNRAYGQGTVEISKDGINTDKFKFWRWYTTYEGKRYYLLMQEKNGGAIRCDLLKDNFASNLWPYWSWAVFPDMTEFWTPSHCDYVREIFMAKAVCINQLLDNAERRNKPQKAIDADKIKNQAELKYRKDGIIHLKKDTDVSKAIQIIETPSIDTPLKVYEALKSIDEDSSGVTAGAKGVADEEGRAAIYQGNQVNVSDKFGLLNKSYSFGYQRFSKLYEQGAREHLVQKVAVDILGPEGVEEHKIDKNDIFKGEESFNVLVEASNAEQMTNDSKKDAKLRFLSAQAQNQIINQKKSFEIQARTVGIGEDEINQLLDTSEFGDAHLMAEAERDIEDIIDGKEIQPNENANTAYQQRILDYTKDHKEDISLEQFARLMKYIDRLGPIVTRNMQQKATDEITKMASQGINTGQEEGAGIPIQPTEPIKPNGNIQNSGAQ